MDVTKFDKSLLILKRCMKARLFHSNFRGAVPIEAGLPPPSYRL